MKSSLAASPAMRSITYEKVTMQEAREAVRDHRPVYHKNWSLERLPGLAEPLLDMASAWLCELPVAVRPVELINRFPRIVNKLAKLWPRPSEWQHVMSELLIVRRGDGIRQGFPVVVARELAALSAYHSTLHPALAQVSRGADPDLAH